MASFLPPHSGLLPKWLMLLAVTSMGNSIQAYSSISYTQRVYAGQPKGDLPASATSAVTPLSARTFGTWTLMTSIVRLYAAYHIDEPAWYQVALLTFIVAFGHFFSELVVFKTARVKSPWLAPAIVATTSNIWMISQYGYYVK